MSGEPKRISQVLITRLALVMVAVCTASITGCQQNTRSPADSALADARSPCPIAHSLGWLGGQSTPQLSTSTVGSPDNSNRTIEVNGLLVSDVNADGPLALAGVRAGDQIVRVGEDWLPIKTNPTLDFIELIETEIDRGKASTRIGVIRSAELVEIEFNLQPKPIDDGLPLASSRIIESTRLSLDFLQTLQQSDGSFGDPQSSRCEVLISTSLAGLAFLSADASIANRYQQSLDRCLEFISTSFENDQFQSADPLTAAYVIQFLAETEIAFTEMNWLDVVGELSFRLSDQQTDSGRWTLNDLVAEANEVSPSEESDEPQSDAVDIVGTFVTNQVLLAIGALERKGFQPESEVIQRACQFLHRQGQLRVPCPIDRRTKAALSAGTAAALAAINCDRNQEILNVYLEEILQRADQLHTNPQFRWPGFLHAALASRQQGNGSWLRFHHQTKYLAISLYDQNGVVHEFPAETDEPIDLFNRIDPTIWRLTHLVIAQSLQSLSLKNSLALNPSDEGIVRDYLGKTFVPPIAADQQSDKEKQRAELTKMIMDMIEERQRSSKAAKPNQSQDSFQK